MQVRRRAVPIQIPRGDSQDKLDDAKDGHFFYNANIKQPVAQASLWKRREASAVKPPVSEQYQLARNPLPGFNGNHRLLLTDCPKPGPNISQRPDFFFEFPA